MQEDKSKPKPESTPGDVTLPEVSSDQEGMPVEKHRWEGPKGKEPIDDMTPER